MAASTFSFPYEVKTLNNILKYTCHSSSTGDRNKSAPTPRLKAMENTTSTYTLSSWEPASSGPCPTTNNLTSPSDDNRFCPSVFDEFLCWPVTKVGERVYLPCPQNIRGLDPTSKPHLLNHLLVYHYDGCT